MNTRILAIGLICLCWFSVSAQNNGFKFGEVRLAELEMKTYQPDSSAAALVLNEFGEAYFDEGKLNFEYHVKIKILTKDGLAYGDFKIPLRKREPNKDEVFSIEAETSNWNNGKIERYTLASKDVFYENTSRYGNYAKFTLPNVKVGSVIEVKYIIKTPFILNFWPWEFQREIPKLQSEFWAKIQGNSQYNISLRGFLKLTKNESSLENECFSFGSAKAGCSLFKFGMKDIPAFKEEDYMTAKSNFIAAVNFELKEIRYFDGRVDKVTKEWKDVEDELMQNNDFGSQIKKAKTLTEDIVKTVVNPDSTSLQNAKRIYGWVKNSFSWNDEVRMYSELGVKKAYESKVGNSADINLILLAAMQNAGLNANPVILSTRSNGTPASELYPVLSEYNYVIVRIMIGEATYLLDATDKFLPFGLLPIHCLNGSGRLLAKKDSNFTNLNAANGKRKKYSSFNLKLDEEGNLSGNVQISYSDYEAAARRKLLSGLNNEELTKHIQNEWKVVAVKNYLIENLQEIDKLFIEKFEIVIKSEEENPKRIYFNPFLQDKWTENPFKSSERLYPVDFGAPLQQIVSVSIKVPANYIIDDFPPSQSLALPAEGGRYIFAANKTENSIVMRNSVLLSKAVYNSNEYASLKELFARIVQIHQTDLVFLRKN
jgi:hypothetical protein